jgi:hypothetical protein
MKQLKTRLPPLRLPVCPGAECGYHDQGVKSNFSSRECLPCKRNPMQPDNFRPRDKVGT